MPHTTQIRKYFFLGFFAHRAGIEHHQIGFVYILGLFITLCDAQNIGHFVRVVLVHLAAKGFDKDFAAHDKVFGCLQRVMV